MTISLILCFLPCLNLSEPGLPEKTPTNDLYAEVSEADTLLLPEKLYAEATRLSQYLFNGPRYHIYDRNADTHQFYRTRDLLPGILRYDGRDYGPFEMHYDIHFGSLIVKQPVGGYLVQLDSAKVEQFTLEKSPFRAIRNHPQLGSAVYQIIYDGNSRLLCHRKKIRFEKMEDRRAIPVFQDVSSYFILIDGDYKRVRRKKDLYHLFPDKKKIIRTYLRKTALPFREDMEQQLLAVVHIIDNQQTGI